MVEYIVLKCKECGKELIVSNQGKSIDGRNCSKCSGILIPLSNDEVRDKPPLGLMPNDIWKLKRYQAIKEAMGRYAGANIEIPKEWINEYIQLSRNLDLE